MGNVKKEMNIYQKIAVLQDVIKVNKANKNNFADFNYRTIQDILAELKPNLKELNLIINFGAGSLDGDKYSLEIRVIDINNLESKIVESGEIYIDRTKSKMDLSQKVLSAKTFLKKSLLEDLLLINEDDDPDSHDNRRTGQQNNTNQNKGSSNKSSGSNQQSEEPTRTKEEAQTISNVKNILYYAADKDQNKMIDLLESNTEFTGKDNKKVPGLRDFNKLVGKRLTVTYGKLQKAYPEAYKIVQDKLSKTGDK